MDRVVSAWQGNSPVPSFFIAETTDEVDPGILVKNFRDMNYFWLMWWQVCHWRLSVGIVHLVLSFSLFLTDSRRKNHIVWWDHYEFRLGLKSDILTMAVVFVFPVWSETWVRARMSTIMIHHNLKFVLDLYSSFIFIEILRRVLVFLRVKELMFISLYCTDSWILLQCWHVVVFGLEICIIWLIGQLLVLALSLWTRNPLTIFFQVAVPPIFLTMSVR